MQNTTPNSNPTSANENSPEVVMRIMDDLNSVIDHQEEMAKSRMLPRREIVLPLHVQFLDHSKTPCSQTIRGVSLDISFAGIGFLCPIDVPTAEYALIQFEDTLGYHQPILVNLKNKKLLGTFYKMGGLFEVDWESTEQPS